MADNNLREYLISLGFNVNKSQQADMVKAVREGAFQANVLFEALKTAVVQFHNVMSQYAEGMNQLFLNSKIFKESAGDLWAWGKAGEAVGISSQQMLGVFKGIATALRTDPWAKGLAVHFSGLSTAAFDALTPMQQALDLIKGLGQLHGPAGEMLQKQFAAKYPGLDFETLKRLLLPDFDPQHFQEMAGKMGINFGDTTEKANALKKALIDLDAEVDVLGQSMAAQYFDSYTAALNRLDDWLKINGPGLVKMIGDISKGIAITGWRALNWQDALKPGGGPPAALGSMVGPGGGKPAPASPPTGAAPNWFQRHMPAWQWLPGAIRGQPAAPSAGAGPYGGLEGARQAFGGRAAATPTGSVARSLTDLITQESNRAGIDPRIMEGIRIGEGPGTHYRVGDLNNGPAYGPWQLNVGRGRLGDLFQRETGLDLRDPRTIPAQARWVAEHIARKLRENPNYNPGSEWFGYHGLTTPGHGALWGDAGYVPTTETARGGDYSPPFSMWGALGISPAQAADIAKSKIGATPWGSLSGAYGAFRTSPYGALPPAGTFDQSSSTLNQKTTIQLFGVGEGNEELGSKIARHQSHVNADLIRNLQNNSVG